MIDNQSPGDGEMSVPAAIGFPALFRLGRRLKGRDQDPTPEEIAAECARIREEWSPEEEVRRGRSRERRFHRTR